MKNQQNNSKYLGWNIVDYRLPNGCKLYWLAGKGGYNE